MHKKISYKNTLNKIGNIANILNNYKWSIIFKNYESLCCTPVIYVLYIQLYYANIVVHLNVLKEKKENNNDLQ